MSKTKKVNNSNYSNNSKGSKKYGKATRGGSKPRTDYKKNQQNVPEDNDFSWYNRNPHLTEASARVPFPYRPGISVPSYGRALKADTQTEKYKITNGLNKIPGLFTLEWVPSVGISDSVTSPISLAGRDIFSRVRSAFSGSIQADAPDFIIHIMAMDSIYSYIAWCKRVYKITNTFSSDNLLTPECLLHGMGFTDTAIFNLKSARTELYGKINELIAMTDQFVVPDIMPVLTRHIWMSERLYADAPTVSSQIYMFNPVGFYKFGTDSSGAGQLTIAPMKVATMTDVNSIYEYGRQLIEAFASWDDCFIINGYLAKAYESDKRFSIAPLNLDEKAELVYNEVVLSQIENATCAPTAVNINNMTVTISQDVGTNTINTNYIFNVEAGMNRATATWDKTRVNVNADIPSAENVIEATRLITQWIDDADVLAPRVTATEIVLNFTITQWLEAGPGKYKWANTNVNNLLLTAITASQAVVKVVAGAFDQFIRAFSTLAAFDWHPLMLAGASVATTEGDVTTYNVVPYIMGDIRNITFISDKELEDINRCCLYSEFNSFAQA